MTAIDEAVAAVGDGSLIVYPTETVYGLGGDALNPSAVERVFNAKDRPRSNPMALAVEAVESAMEYIEPDQLTEEFMHEFLPGSVTVIAPRRQVVPDVLTGGRDRVGVRVPDHEVALDLLARTPPLTATSANVSGREPVRRVSDLDATIGRSCAAVIDGGETPGGASTVVDVEAGRIHRRGVEADAVVRWLDQH